MPGGSFGHALQTGTYAQRTIAHRAIQTGIMTPEQTRLIWCTILGYGESSRTAGWAELFQAEPSVSVGAERAASGRVGGDEGWGFIYTMNLVWHNVRQAGQYHPHREA